MELVKALLLVLCVLGILVSCYAYYVEKRAERQDYEGALCDISPSVSCTVVLTSE